MQPNTASTVSATGLRILIQTLLFSQEERNFRAIDYDGDDPQPTYHSAEGRVCFVGRWLVDPEGIQEKYGDLPVGQLLCEAGSEEDLFVESARGLPSHFWEGLEELHDDFACWQESGRLTQLGIDSVRAIVHSLDQLHPR